MDVAFVTTKVAKETLGVQEDALRKWSEQGLIPSIRTPGNHRRYNISEFIRVRGNTQAQEAIIEEKESICYCRVSSHGQKEDLERQVSYMQERFPGYRIIRDIGSGINFKRRGLRTILELACKGYVSEVVVAYRDRLCRFAFELVEWLLSLHGVKLVVLNEDLEGSESGELAEDLLSIVHVFNCRIQGRRKYQGRKDAKGQDKVKHQEGGQ
jgi:predicted site-specific integrase-resolvase